MKEYYGNYLGLCINNDDPERRGRVQIFIPHIMPALFKDWNEAGKDIQLLCVGDNIPDSLPGYIVEKLKKMLPWAECASPILGDSAPGQLANGNYNQSPVTGGGGDVAPISGAGLPENVTIRQDTGTPRSELTSLLSQAATSVYGPGATVEIFSGQEGRTSGTDRHPDGWAADVRFRDPQGNLITGDGLAPVVKFWHDNQLGSTGLNGDSVMGVGSLHMDIVGGRFGRPLRSGEALYWSYRGGYSPAMANALSNVNSDKQTYKQIPIAGATPVNSGMSLFSDSSTFTSIGGQSIQNAQHASGPSDLLGSATFADSTIQIRGGGAADIASNQAPTLGGNVPAAPTESNAPASAGAGGGGGLLVDQSGRVNGEQLKAEILRIIQNNPSSIYNNGKVPVNGQRYGLDGTAQSWANFYGKLAGFESSYDANAPFKNSVVPGTTEPGGSGGLFQLGVGQVGGRGSWGFNYPDLAARYGIDPNRSYTQQDLFDPNLSTRAVLMIGEGLLRENFVVGPTDPNSGQGLGRTIGKLSWGKIASGKDPGTGAQDPSIRPEAATSMVMTTDPNGATATLNINNMAKGVFTYPAAGSLLWVFFREGNPLFPVYFAANYGQREWESAFRIGSDAPGYKPAPTPDNPITSTGTMINWGVGGIRVENTNDPTNPSNSQRSVMFYGHDGSNMFMNDGYHQIYSKMDRRDQVDGSRFQSTLGTKEEIVQSDSNSVTMGDRIIKVGNITPEAINAMNRIHEIIKEIMKPLTETEGFQPKPFPPVPNSGPGAKYVPKAIAQSKQFYNVPEPAPYKIPAQEILRDLGFDQPEVQQPPDVEAIKEIPITPPTLPENISNNDLASTALNSEKQGDIVGSINTYKQILSRNLDNPDVYRRAENEIARLNQIISTDPNAAIRAQTIVSSTQASTNIDTTSRANIIQRLKEVITKNLPPTP